MRLARQVFLKKGYEILRKSRSTITVLLRNNLYASTKFTRCMGHPVMGEIVSAVVFRNDLP